MTSPRIATAQKMACPRCSDPIVANPLETTASACGRCGLEYLTLGGRPRQAAATPAERALSDHAVCFFHEQNAAQSECERCGRFVCRLCEIEIDGQRLCPRCLELGRDQATLPSLRQSDFLYDSLAALVGWGWILFWPSWIVAMPTVAWLQIRHGGAPRLYLTPRRGWRFALAWVGLAWPVALGAALFLVVRVRVTS